MPPPPKLDRGADGNDWEAYYDFGVDILRRNTSNADAAFYWANRLNPTRAEPLYARWVAFWMLDISEWPDYLYDSPAVVSRPEIIASDSLRLRAWERNPLVNQALLLYLFERISRRDPVSQGWIAYANGFYPRALEEFGAAVTTYPEYPWIHYDVALVYTQMGRYDSAAMQIESLLAALRSTEKKQVVHLYESKEMMEYALGLLYAARGRLADARQAQERALEENLAFAPAHAALAQLAGARGDTGTAVRELALAVELAPGDGAMRYWYGNALTQAQRPAEALEQLTLALKLEPYFADVQFSLAAAYAARSDSAKAVAEYAEYVKHAPRSASQRIDQARAAAAQLGSQTP